MPNLLLVGDTNNGKTALVNRFLARHQPQAASDGTTSCIPIVFVQAPPLPDERRFYQAILSKVFAPFRPSRTAANLQFETVQLLASVGVKMLIIDEIQHVLAGPTQRAADSDRGGRNARCVQRRPDGPATCEPV
jgi:hypothetical protein